MAQIDTLLQLALQHGASDLHIRVGSPPLMRVHGSLCPLPDDTHNANNPEVLLEILSEEHLHRFEKHHDLDFAYELPDVGRFRVNFLRQRQGIGAVFRVIPGRIPDLASLGLPQTVFELTLPGALGQDVEDHGDLILDPLAGRPTKTAITELLDSDGLEMVYQPVAHLPAHRGGVERVVGYESLARFPHSTPPEWFEVAGDAGLRLQLELAAIRLAVAGFTAPPDQGFLALNLSDGTLTSPKLYEALSGVDPGRVVLELSDVALIKSYEMTNRGVDVLRERGYRLAIDDVGAGEIDLWHILRLDPSIIKVDMSVVRDLHQTPRNAALIRAIAAMSQDLGIMVIAEGVESESERDRLIELGVEYGQGYLLGKPQTLRWQTRVLSGD